MFFPDGRSTSPSAGGALSAPWPSSARSRVSAWDTALARAALGVSRVVVYIHAIDKARRVATPQNLVLSQGFSGDFLFTNKLTSWHKMSSVRYGTRLGALKENWFILFSN